MSLQDQLLKAGLVDNNKAKKVRTDKRKQSKKARKSNQEIVNETAIEAKKRREEQAERDRQLNQEKQKKLEQKAIQSQIQQLIKMNQLDRGDGDISYRFMFRDKAQSIYVTPLIQKRLASGKLTIVLAGEQEGVWQFEVVPPQVSEKIALRDSSRLVELNGIEEDEEDDYYADFQIPDDLMW
jgi:uncharacterized protein YaiL (DUF2058 family)|tara:strand:+ start:2993 stop:3538 length:546 start_codon:yes stop_codon:yes gene_type:complete